MRKANTNDLFNIARLINDLDVGEELFNAQHDTEDLEKIGFNAFFNVLMKATTKNAQEKIYAVLAEPFEIDPQEVGLMEIEVLFKNFLDCFNIKTVINFIKRVGPLMK